MQGYSKGSVGPFMTVHYNAYVEVSKQGYNNGSLGPFITVHLMAK
jgi:hypothetical protein